jgi:hypothetical protein
VRRWTWGLASLIACAHAPVDSSDPESEPSVAEYAALRVGAQRTYAVQFQGQTGRRTITVRGEKDGYYLDDAGGAWALTPEGLRDRDRYLIRRPLAAGTSWSAVQSASAVEHYEIRQVGQPCTVRAGRFDDCLVVESRLRRDASMTLFATWTWVRGVGLARVETRAQIEGQMVPQTEQDLVHYDLRAPAAP